MRLQLVREEQLAKVPRDQFGNPLPGYNLPRPGQGGGVEGMSEGALGDGGNSFSQATTARAGGDGRGVAVGLEEGMSPPGGRKAGKGGVAARAVKEEGMPAVVSHDEYKSQIEQQIAEKKRQQEERRRREEEEERRDNERLQRQLEEMRQQAEKEQQRRKQKEEEAEAKRQAMLVGGAAAAGGGGAGQLLARTPPPLHTPVPNDDGDGEANLRGKF